MVKCFCKFVLGGCKVDDGSDGEADSASGLKNGHLISKARLYAGRHIAVLFVVF